MLATHTTTTGPARRPQLQTRSPWEWSDGCSQFAESIAAMERRRMDKEQERRIQAEEYNFLCRQRISAYQRQCH